MRVSVALVNLVLGSVYASYGVMSIADLRRGWRSRGELHFGLAWVAMAFTCGPHHLEHGLHLLTDGASRGGGLDLFVVLVGVPAGVTWFLLRAEAFRGGRGDRVVSGNPRWVKALPYVAAVYAIAVVVWVRDIAASPAVLSAALTPNLWLLVLYMVIGFYLLRTQLRSHRDSGGWSISGLSLTVVFPTCAIMHTAWMAYAAAGFYDVHWHLLAIDWLSVPAALYFVWVVRALDTGLFRSPQPARPTSMLAAHMAR